MINDSVLLLHPPLPFPIPECYQETTTDEEEDLCNVACSSWLAHVFIPFHRDCNGTDNPSFAADQDLSQSPLMTHKNQPPGHLPCLIPPLSPCLANLWNCCPDNTARFK